jgi:hypothetical protein
MDVALGQAILFISFKIRRRNILTNWAAAALQSLPARRYVEAFLQVSNNAKH